MKFTETQRKLDELMNDYEMAVIGENRGRNRSGYNTKEDKYYQKRRELKEFVAELEEAQRWIPANERLPDIEDGGSKDYDVVLTYPFRRDVIVATWSYDALDKTHRRRWFDCSSDEWGPDDITEYVTHWRERPTPPEVQE